ncbi:MAG: bacteriorhodopsin [Porticoccus sp.]|jgi:bacteriorhodopsin|nr:bacteriorhodopsin [Porticoccus sp.]|tara:strand:+ start:624 stop:1367 length:744 start_codon:yes stop_codon:yes gene_type:complete
MDLFDYNLVFNSLSFAIATFGAATVFMFAQRSQVAPAYKTALTLSGLVCLIAFYHYVRMFESFEHAYTLSGGVVTATGAQFNDAYRYVDWLLTVPLLLLELVLVMRLSKEETFSKGSKLAFAAALMVILGYPGEISGEAATRWTWWIAAMIPFLYIVKELVSGLSASIASQPAEVKDLVGSARTLTILSWCFYPIVFILPMLGVGEMVAGEINAAVQVGYTIADIVAKAGFGVMIYMIAQRKSDAGA